jgi:hypothetical protein
LRSVIKLEPFSFIKLTIVVTVMAAAPTSKIIICTEKIEACNLLIFRRRENLINLKAVIPYMLVYVKNITQKMKFGQKSSR